MYRMTGQEKGGKFQDKKWEANFLPTKTDGDKYC